MLLLRVALLSSFFAAVSVAVEDGPVPGNSEDAVDVAVGAQPPQQLPADSSDKRTLPVERASLDQEDIVAESPNKPSKSVTEKDSKASITFYHGFFASFSVIVVSELGDKTWFIAVIMAMRHSRLTVFAGAMTALSIMTVLSACLGWVTQLIPRVVTYYVSTALFALFGLKMLHEGWNMSPSESQEGYEEAQSEIQKRQMDEEKDKFIDAEEGRVGGRSNTETGMNPPKRKKDSPWRIFAFISKIFLEAFTLTFVAEWGDRSQLTTIILGARESLAGTILGGILGHSICTGIAVVGGKLVAQRISVRTVTLVGGVVFIAFALSAFFISDGEDLPRAASFSSSL